MRVVDRLCVQYDALPSTQGSQQPTSQTSAPESSQPVASAAAEKAPKKKKPEDARLRSPSQTKERLLGMIRAIEDAPIGLEETLLDVTSLRNSRAAKDEVKRAFQTLFRLPRLNRARTIAVTLAELGVTESLWAEMAEEYRAIDLGQGPSGDKMAALGEALYRSDSRNDLSSWINSIVGAVAGIRFAILWNSRNRGERGWKNKFHRDLFHTTHSKFIELNKRRYTNPTRAIGRRMTPFVKSQRKAVSQRNALLRLWKKFGAVALLPRLFHPHNTGGGPMSTTATASLIRHVTKHQHTLVEQSGYLDKLREKYDTVSDAEDTAGAVRAWVETSDEKCIRLIYRLCKHACGKETAKWAKDVLDSRPDLEHLAVEDDGEVENGTDNDEDDEDQEEEKEDEEDGEDEEYEEDESN
ncbi:hypothetical protein DFP72DRAFT_856611 [Ephemerocybe angulata]|uniref:Uncharacterized protein n=1 Tax=Ephemerocybe angulata TaxID=980116 RepID=A0A8H6LYL2_9AGAR|nr:hypothetical protein DFP72DRAFT_856611 [Tulosesus angulatus]